MAEYRTRYQRYSRVRLLISIRPFVQPTFGPSDQFGNTHGAISPLLQLFNTSAYALKRYFQPKRFLSYCTEKPILQVTNKGTAVIERPKGPVIRSPLIDGLVYHAYVFETVKKKATYS